MAEGIIMKEFKNFTPHEEPEEGLEEYLESFIESRRKDLEEIKANYVKNDHESVKKILHKWEGFVEPYGFGGLRLFSTQIRACIQLHKSELFEKIYAETKAYLNYKEVTLKSQ